MHGMMMTRWPNSVEGMDGASGLKSRFRMKKKKSLL